MELSLIGLAVLLVLIFLRVPVALALGLVGFAGLSQVIGTEASLSLVAQTVRDAGMSYTLTVVPLFILMGTLIGHAGLSNDLYSAANAYLGHRKGGLAMATVVASGGFAAMSGSSLATAGTMARVAYPEMRRYNYSRSLATASIAAGGTLGILIPPSIMMVFYGILTETGIGELFAAGFIPGLLGVIGYMLAVRFVTWRDPEAGPPGERLGKTERRKSLRRVGLVLLLIALVLGGIYGGVFTPTEAAGVGAFGGLVIAAWRKSLTWPVLSAVLTDTVITTAKMFAIFLGALVFSDMIGFSGLPDAVVAWLTGSGIPPLAVILVMVLIYLVMGCFLESLSMILITIPVFFPVVVSLGFDPIWFGIIVVVAVEIGLITPPLGMNLFMLKSTVPEVETSHLFRGIAPFVGIDIIRIALLILLPGISLLLPRLFFG